MEQGMKLSEIQQKMIDLKIMQERLNIKELKEKQELLFGMIGVKINGEAAGYMTDLILYGKGTGTAKKYAPLTQHLDLMFTASSGSKLKAEAVFRLQNLFGGAWGVQDIYGIRKFTITGDFPVSFVLGDYAAKLTPFTIWSCDEARETEAKIFSDKRNMNKKELYLENNAWPVTGGSLKYVTDVFGAAVAAEVMAARLQEATKNNYQTAAGFSQALSSPFTFQYEQYLWAGRIESDFALKDILKAGVNFAEIRDIKGTGLNQAAALLDNYTASADASLKLFGIAKAKAEFAYSSYHVSNSVLPQAWQNSYINDTALMTGAEAEYMNTKIEAEFFVVGNSFTAYAAQTRMYDGYNNYPYLTQNNTWNISQAIPAYILAAKIYPFTRYNNIILADYFAPGHNMMPYNFYENNAAPYGDSTPNRQGVKVKLSGSYLDAMVEPFARFIFASEIVSYLPGVQSTCPREYMVLEGGLKAKVWNFEFKGGYKFEVTDNSYTLGGTHLESAIIDAGLEYRLFDRLTLSAGFKDITYMGTEYPYSYNGTKWAYAGRTSYDASITSIGGGVDFEITKQAKASVSYTDTKITDRINTDNTFGAQEFDARVFLKF
jgi:hypothetical protein